MPCQCDIERGSVAPAWFRATIIIVLVSNLAAMFSYPPRPWFPTRDTLGVVIHQSIQSSIIPNRVYVVMYGKHTTILYVYNVTVDEETVTKVLSNNISI
jgi:hypothetical protein